MNTFTATTFTIPELTGISKKNIEEHIKLYEGYVKFTNHILVRIDELAKDAEKNAYELGELQRRFGFEWGGMKNHECYFSLLEGGPNELSADSALRAKITEQFGSFDAWFARFKAIALTRGIGWTMLCYDKATDTLENAWVDEQHLGQLANTDQIIALDMWEHAYVGDYWSSGKKQYVEDFFKNINWSVAEKNFTEATK